MMMWPVGYLEGPHDMYYEFKALGEKDLMEYLNGEGYDPVRVIAPTKIVMPMPPTRHYLARAPPAKVEWFLEKSRLDW